MQESETKEVTGACVAACGSTRCKFNVDLKCTAETISVNRSGECEMEQWGMK
jgi:hypothetical protein